MRRNRYPTNASVSGRGRDAFTDSGETPIDGVSAEALVQGLRERGHFGARGRFFFPMLFGLALVMAVGLGLSDWVAEGGAPRREYRLTPEGRAALSEWASLMCERGRLIDDFLAREARLDRGEGG